MFSELRLAPNFPLPTGRYGTPARKIEIPKAAFFKAVSLASCFGYDFKDNLFNLLS